jgi:methyltransferase (TIGR00027 family)
LLGDRAGELIGYHRGHAGHPILSAARAQVVCRSRYAEDRLARAAAHGIQQYVIVGAGLDSFGYRPGLASQLRVFEVDHPVTQQWKRQALAAARIPVPGTVTFVPADLATGSLAELLPASGFDPARPAVVSCLGVTMYLSRDAIGGVLAAIGTLAPGTELIADYMLPPSLRDAAGNSYAEQIGAVAAERGEPWLTFLSPGEATALLAEHGIEPAEHVHQRDAVDAAMWQRSDSLRPTDLSMLTHATVTAHPHKGRTGPPGSDRLLRRHATGRSRQPRAARMNKQAAGNATIGLTEESVWDCCLGSLTAPMTTAACCAGWSRPAGGGRLTRNSRRSSGPPPKMSPRWRRRTADTSGRTAPGI